MKVKVMPKPQFQEIPIELLYEPKSPSREVFEEIAELALTIKAHGLLQPVLVKEIEGKNGFEILAGLRRFRACQKNKMSNVPCLIFNGEIDETEMLQITLVENLQRQDLKVFEEIQLVKTLKERLGLTNREIGVKLGVSDSFIGDLLLIAAFPPNILRQVIRCKGGKSHPRDLSLSKAVMLARANLPTEQLRALVQLIQRVGFKRGALARKLARTPRKKIKRVKASRGFWKELIRTVKPRLDEFRKYWSEYAKLREWEDVGSFHLAFEINLPKDLAEKPLSRQTD